MLLKFQVIKKYNHQLKVNDKKIKKLIADLSPSPPTAFPGSMPSQLGFLHHFILSPSFTSSTSSVLTLYSRSSWVLLPLLSLSIPFFPDPVPLFPLGSSSSSTSSCSQALFGSGSLTLKLVQRLYIYIPLTIFHSSERSSPFSPLPTIYIKFLL